MGFPYEVAQNEETSNSFSVDPYEDKCHLAEERQKCLLESLRANCTFNTSAGKHTFMLQLILLSKVKLSDKHIMNILGLKEHSTNHCRLYSLILNLLGHIASQLKLISVSLHSFPLTDLQDLCYRVADCFDSLFYVPVTSSHDDLSCALSFTWNDRFNSMWPLLYLLAREYEYK